MSSTSVRWNEVTALFGGTFDPPHLGHRKAVDGLFSEPGVRTVRILPSPTPAHKPAMASAEHRVAMARLAFAPSAAYPHKGHLEFDLCEIDRAKAHPGSFTYSFDTLSEIRRQIPKLAFVIGTDQVEKLSTWHRYPEVLGLCHWIVLQRKGTAETWRQTLESSGQVHTETGGWRVRSTGTFIKACPTEAPALSSTQIRESLARSGNPPDHSLLPDVYAYLMKHRLYGTRQS